MQSHSGDSNCKYSVVLSMVLWSRYRNWFMDEACKKGFELLGDFNLMKVV